MDIRQRQIRQNGSSFLRIQRPESLFVVDQQGPRRSRGPKTWGFLSKKILSLFLQIIFHPPDCHDGVGFG